MWNDGFQFNERNADKQFEKTLKHMFKSKYLVNKRVRHSGVWWKLNANRTIQLMRMLFKIGFLMTSFKPANKRISDVESLFPNNACQ